MNDKLQILLALWQQLQDVTTLTSYVKTGFKQDGERMYIGRAQVVIDKTCANTLIFNETGFWEDEHGAHVYFSNVLRWTLDVQALVISLEHLRRGPKAPVFLFYLTPSTKHSLVSVNPYLCGEDTYCGQLHFDHQGLRLNWRVIGPKKNDEIHCCYLWEDEDALFLRIFK